MTKLWRKEEEGVYLGVTNASFCMSAVWSKLISVQNPFDLKNKEVKECYNSLVHQLQVQRSIAFCLCINLDLQTLVVKVHLSLHHFICK